MCSVAVETCHLDLEAGIGYSNRSPKLNLFFFSLPSPSHWKRGIAGNVLQKISKSVQLFVFMTLRAQLRKLQKEETGVVPRWFLHLTYFVQDHVELNLLT